MILPELSRSMLKNSLVLGLFAVVTVGAVTVLQQGTAERIQASERAAQLRVLGEILLPLRRAAEFPRLCSDDTRDLLLGPG